MNHLPDRRPVAPCTCHHNAPPAATPFPVQRSVARPLAIAGGVVAGGAVLTMLALAVALTAAAVGVSGVVVLLLVRELRKGGER